MDQNTTHAQTPILKEIPVSPWAAILRLAALAPAPPAKTGELPKRRSAKASDLGPLDVAAYLTAYGIEHNVKEGPGKTLYRLAACLFDESHGRNESAIVQDASGKITYQCFHTSCKGKRTWGEARALISKDESLARFCRGYDPDYKPTHKTQKTPAPFQDQPVGPQSKYLSVSARGRVSFNPALFADHLAGEFAPILYEGRDFGELFWRYDPSGLWEYLPTDVIEHRASELLGEYATSQRITGTRKLLESKLYKTPEALLVDPMWLNLKNGMLHVETMELRPHGPEFMSRVQLPLEFCPQAQCSLWIETLAGIFADDVSKCDVLQEFFGYCLYPRIIFPAALFGIGKGGNGKGTVQHVLEAMLGQANVCHISLKRMAEKFGPVELREKLLNACGETSTEALEVTRFKEICAADLVQAEVKYGKDITFRPIAKHYISMNEFPGLKDKTDAFFRRIIVMEFKQQFKNEKDDKDLRFKLTEELDGIFAWSLEGLKRVLAQKAIRQPESVQNAKQRLRAWVNPIITFVDEQCDCGEDKRCWPPDLYKKYVAWCEEGHERPKSKKRFYDEILGEFNAKRKRDHGAKREHFAGIGIKEDDQYDLGNAKEH